MTPSQIKIGQCYTHSDNPNVIYVGIYRKNRKQLSYFFTSKSSTSNHFEKQYVAYYPKYEDSWWKHFEKFNEVIELPNFIQNQVNESKIILTPETIVVGAVYGNKLIDKAYTNSATKITYKGCLIDGVKKLESSLGIHVSEPERCVTDFWKNFYRIETKDLKKKKEGNIWSFAVSFENRAKARQAKKYLTSLYKSGVVASTPITKIARNRIK